MHVSSLCQCMCLLCADVVMPGMAVIGLVNESNGLDEARLLPGDLYELPLGKRLCRVCILQQCCCCGGTLRQACATLSKPGNMVMQLSVVSLLGHSGTVCCIGQLNVIYRHVCSEQKPY